MIHPWLLDHSIPELHLMRSVAKAIRGSSSNTLSVGEALEEIDQEISARRKTDLNGEHTNSVVRAWLSSKKKSYRKRV